MEREAPSEKRIRKADAETDADADADAEGRKEGRKEANPSVYVAMKPSHSRAIRDFRPSVHRNLRIGSFTLRGNDRRNSLKKKEEKFNVKHCHFLFFFLCVQNILSSNVFYI